MNEVSFGREDGKYVPVVARPAAEARGAGGEQSAVPRLMQYFRIALRWKWLILGSIALALLLGIIITLLPTPLYTPTTPPARHHHRVPRLTPNRAGARSREKPRGRQSGHGGG